MQFTKLKKINAIRLEVKETKVLWFLSPLASPAELAGKIPEDIDIVLVTVDEPVNTPENVEEWDLFSQDLKNNQDAIVIFSAGEYRIKDVHLKGSSLDSVVHYVLDTSEGTVGFFQSEPSDSFVKQYAPIDVLVGHDTALSGRQLDFEPFHVVLSTYTEEYKKKTGLSEVHESEKVTVKKIEASARDGIVTMTVTALV